MNWTSVVGLFFCERTPAAKFSGTFVCDRHRCITISFVLQTEILLGGWSSVHHVKNLSGRPSDWPCAGGQGLRNPRLQGSQVCMNLLLLCTIKSALLLKWKTGLCICFNSAARRCKVQLLLKWSWIMFLLVFSKTICLFAVLIEFLILPYNIKAVSYCCILFSGSLSPARKHSFYDCIEKRIKWVYKWVSVSLCIADMLLTVTVIPQNQSILPKGWEKMAKHKSQLALTLECRWGSQPTNTEKEEFTGNFSQCSVRRCLPRHLGSHTPFSGDSPFKPLPSHLSQDKNLLLFTLKRPQ